MKQSKGLLRSILIALTAVIIGLKIYSWNAESLVGNAMPMPFGYGFAVVLSGSMEPALSVNDLIVVRENENYNIGDIVVYQAGSELIVHRIIETGDGTVTTMGDANPVADAPIHSKNIKGRVFLSIPMIGVIVNFLKSTPGVLILLFAAFFLTEMSFRRQKQRNEQDIDAIKAEIRRLKDEQSQ